MTGRDLFALMPFWILAGTAVLIILAIAIKRNLALTAWLAFLGCAASFLSVFKVAGLASVGGGPLLVIDTYALFFMGLLAAGGMFIILLGYAYFRPLGEDGEEFFLLVLLAVLGAAVLAASRHFVSLFLGLELLSVALYALISYRLDRAEAIEAGIKYFVLASASAAFLVFGMALIYAGTGTMDIGQAIRGLESAAGFAPVIFLGIALVVVGIGFKLAVVPFHMWAPDVYQGAPTPVAALISTVSKGGMLALLFRFFAASPVSRRPALLLLFALISGASMFVGNLLALRQSRIKRILAYSSIAQLGYLLIAFATGSGTGAEAAAFYLAAYFIMMIAAFGVVALLDADPRQGDEGYGESGGDADKIEDYRGLFWRRPGLSAVLTASLLSLAGIPLTAGFIGKFYVAAAGVGSSLWTLVILLIVNSAIGLYYYLRIIVAMYSRPESGKPEDPENDGDMYLRYVSPKSPSQAGIPVAGWLALVLLTILLIWFGVFPSGLISVIKLAAAALAGPTTIP